MPLPRLLFSAGFCAAAFVAAPFASAQETQAPKLPDDEVLPQLQGGEIVEWNKAVAARAGVIRDLQRAKELVTPPREALVGFQAREVAEKKERGEKLATDAAARQVELDKTFDRLRAVAATRINAGALTLLCPVQKLDEALKSAAAELVSVSDKVGYEKISVAGVFLPAGGRLAGDAGLGGSLREALVAAGGKVAEAPTAFAGGSLKAGADGVVVAEVYPLADRTGAVLGVRLVDSRSFRIVSSTLAFIPSNTQQPQYSSYGRPECYEVVFTDRRNFIGKLGGAKEWSFGAEGDDIGVSLMKSVLSTRRDIVVNGYSFLAEVLGGPKADSVSKALWVVSRGPKAMEFEVKSRAVGNASSPIAVGSVVLRPYVKPQQ